MSDGYLISREQLVSAGKQFFSSASSGVLNRTPNTVKDCVRLYFRPLTPTQYHSEGIQPSQKLGRSKYPEAHCPIPIFFLFDSGEILTRSDCQFSDGGLGSMGQVYNTACELMNLPWTKIYHTGWFNPNDPSQSNIAFHRNAEIIIPKKLDLSALRSIHCRSVAEKETLLHLLDSDLRVKYGSIITASTRRTLFNRRHTFIENVRLSTSLASFQFSPDTKSPGPFNIKVSILDLARGVTHRWESVNAASGLINVPIKEPISNYEIRLHLDNILVYANVFEELDIPF